jgi:hypothetical protein
MEEKRSASFFRFEESMDSTLLMREKWSVKVCLKPFQNPAHTFRHSTDRRLIYCRARSLTSFLLDDSAEGSIL